MKMKVDQVAILSSNTGEGLKVGDKTIGCAKITQLTLEDGKTLQDYAKEGLCLGYKPVKIENGEGENPSVEIQLIDDLKAGANYVIFIRDGEEVSIVLNTLDFTRLFQLPDEDAAQMDKYLGMLAKQRQLEMLRYEDIETGEESIFFVNQFDREINELVLDEETDAATAVNVYNNMVANVEFRTELQTDNFIKMFLMTIVQTGQDRYNKLHKTDIVKEVAEKLATVTYWKDGVLYKPSVKDINDLLTDVSDNIRIG
jgi:hypothetical protein